MRTFWLFAVMLCGCADDFATAARKQGVPAVEIAEVERLFGAAKFRTATLADFDARSGSAVALAEGHVVSLRLIEVPVERVGRLQLPALQSLELLRTGLKTIEGLERAPQLEKLSLKHNALSTLAGLELPRLKWLDVSENPLTSLEGVPETLETLVLTDGPLTKLDGLRRCPSLWYLNLARQRLVTLEGLPELPSLRILVLAGNPLTSLEGLERAPSLQELDLQQTACSPSGTDFPFGSLISPS